MNDTVKKMVDLLFQDTEMNQEAQALYDELMANCQERFSDLVAQGHSADDAIGCVMESLKGMDEVISQYPRKAKVKVEKKFTIDVEDDDMDENDDDGMDENDMGGGRREFDASKVEVISYDARAIDLVCDATAGNDIVIDYGDLKNVEISLDGGKLSIVKKDSVNRSFSFNNMNFSIPNILGLAKLLGSEIGGDGEIHISLPMDKAFALEFRSTSGDFNIEGVSLKSITADTMSGDILLVPSIASKLSGVRLNTASGDIQMELAADEINAKTMSGDIKAHCECDTLGIVSVSGDVKFKGHAKEINAKSVSGDVKLRNLGSELKKVNAVSTSGNVRVKLPSDIGAVELHAKSISGNVSNEFKSISGEPSVYVCASTVSGNVEVLADNE